MRIFVRTVILALPALLGLAFLVPNAGAGGSTWYFDRPFYEPGDFVRAGAAVSWGHNGDLGTPEDGPYGVWIVAATDDPTWGDTSAVADLIERGRYVTDVSVELGPGEINGVRYGPNVAQLEFRMPQLPAGRYQLLHCNYPCTTMLGDILFGWFWVGPPDPAQPATSGHQPLTTDPPPPAPTIPNTTLPPVVTVEPTPLTRAAESQTGRPAEADEADVAGLDLGPVSAAAIGAIALAVVGTVAVVRHRHTPEP